VDFNEIFGETYSLEQGSQDITNKKIRPKLIPTIFTSQGLLTIMFSHELLVPRNPYQVIN